MNVDDANTDSNLSISQAFQTLPFFADDLYLAMQATNLELVDTSLEDLEAALLAEYMELERTPSMSTMFVSALSQLWLFGVYELLRTWRQRAKEVLRWHNQLQSQPVGEREKLLAGKRREIEHRSANPEWAVVEHWSSYERVASEISLGEEVGRAIDRTELVYKRIEAFRVALAKHELPGSKGSFAMAPGYGRIDLSTGSITWRVILRGNEVDSISRREIAEELRRLPLRKPQILPDVIQERVKKLPNMSYGIKRVAVAVEGGLEFGGVFVAWNREVVGVHGHSETPFEVEKVIDVRPDPAE